MIPTFSDIFRKSVCYAHNGCAAGDTAALGFVLHVEKSIFFPQQKIVFLGFELNSATMKIKLTN